MKYPVGVQSFEKLITEQYVYVDKTDLVYRLAQQNVCFLSRPRRFGKSLLISTLEAYFSGKKDLFKGLKIDKLENDWTEYPVIRIDFARGNYKKAGELNQIIEEQLYDYEKLYGRDENYKTLSGRLLNLIKTAERTTGRKVVVLIDEYDKPMLDVLGKELEQINRDILKGLYGTFKEADDYIRFVFLTGVTKFSQVSVFSGFNQPDDISMDSRFDAICGITEEELYSVFAEPIKELAEINEYTVEEMKTELKKQYDGYHFSSNLSTDIYNPFSIINAFNKMFIDDYWYKSGTPTYLAELIEGRNINMQKLTGQAYESRYFVDYRADAEDPLAMLYQSGYLTIKGYNKRYREYTLDFPNDEVRRSFVTLTANSYFGKTEDTSSDSRTVEEWLVTD